jgi:Tol biopolymer transport system component
VIALGVFALGLSLLIGQAASASPAAAPPGGEIVFSRNGDIWMMRADGSHQKQITSARHDDHWPALSRSGDRIAFVRGVNGSYQLFVVGTDGTGLHRLLRTAYDDSGPTWSPGDKWILFSEENNENGGCAHCQTVLLVVSPDGKHAGRFSPVLDDVNDFPDWSDDGHYVAWGAEGVFVAHADGSNIAGHGTFPIILGFSYADPALSPDDRRIAFDDDNRIRVDVVDLENAKVDSTMLITGPPGKQGEPDWSPDGTHIVFTSSTSDGIQSQIWIVNPDGTHLHQLTRTAPTLHTPNPKNEEPSWGTCSPTAGC